MRLLPLLLLLLTPGCALDITAVVRGSGDGVGQVSGDSGDFFVDCTVEAGETSGTCRSEFIDQGGGGQLPMVASPAPGSVFVQWTGCAEIDGAECLLAYSAEVDPLYDSDNEEPDTRFRSARVCFNLEATGLDPSACVEEGTLDYSDRLMQDWTQDGVTLTGDAEASAGPATEGGHQDGLHRVVTHTFPLVADTKSAESHEVALALIDPDDFELGSSIGIEFSAQLKRELSYLPTGQGTPESENVAFFYGQSGVRRYLPSSSSFVEGDYRRFVAWLFPSDAKNLDDSSELIEFGVRITTEVSNSIAGDFSVIYRLDDYRIGTWREEL